MNEIEYRFRSAPLTPAIAVFLIEEMIQSSSVTSFRRLEIARQLEAAHLQRGGLRGRADLLAIVKKALRNMADQKIIETSAMVYGGPPPSNL